MPSALQPSLLLRLALQGALAVALLAPPVWAAPFTSNADGTVTDQATSLVWDACPLGQSGTGCATDSATSLSWPATLDAAKAKNTEAYKGHTDWRVPNIKELESLVGITAASPAIDTAAFPATPAGFFWSSTSFAPGPASAWVVNFYNGDSYANSRTITSYVRLVRSGQSFAFFDALGDTTAPTTTAGPTAIPGANGTTASASVTVNEAATGFWQVLPAAAPAPTPAALLALGAGQQVALAANVAGSIAISGLTKGTAYTLYFIARDGAGNAQASVASAAFTTPREPDAPTGVVATPGAVGSGQVTVAWSTPADNGSAITGYTVVPAGTGAACTASPCVISGLANAAAYSFTVAATNGVGTGSSATSNTAILQGTQAISFNAQGGQTFVAGGTFGISPAATASSGLAVAYTSLTPGVCTVAIATVSIVSAGTCTIAADQGGDSYWVPAAQVPQNITIGKGAQTITFGAQGGQTFVTGGTFGISPGATASSGLSVAYTSLTTGVCTVVNATVSIVSAGTCTIAANQGGDANWNAATQVTQGITIGKGTQTITFGAQGGQTFTPGGTFAISPVATSSSGLTVTYSSTTPLICTVSTGTVTMVAAGTCTIAADQAGDANWNAATQVSQGVTIGKGTQTITFGAQSGQTFALGGTFAINPAATASSGLTVTYSSTTPLVCTVSTGTVTTVAAGTCTIAADQTGDGNWNAATQVAQSVTIGKGTQTITFGTQSGKTFASGGTFAINPAATASSGLAVAYSSSTPLVCTVSNGTVTMVAAGTCTIAADQTGDANWNAATQVTQGITIGKGTQTITFGAQGGQTFTPGGTFAISPVATSSSGLTVVYSSTTPLVCTVSNGTVTMVTAGTCTIAADQVGDANWNAAAQVTQNVAIGKAAQTITFNAQGNQTYSSGGTFTITPLATASSNLVVTYSSLTASVCTVSNSTVAMVAAGTCTLAANQAGDANWNAAMQVTQNVVVGATIPGAPTAAQATPAGSGQVTVTWVAPADMGGGITSYTVSAQPGGQTCTPTPPTASTCTFSGLTNGQTYTFTVQATNGAGTGPASAPSNPVTPLANNKAFSGPSPTGSGMVAATVSGGGATCGFERVQLLSAASVGAPAGRVFPHGVLDFVLSGCNTSPVTVAINYPSNLPLAAQYWKRAGGTWSAFAGAVLGGSTATLTLVDGGAGDDDNAQNGRIVDPGGASMLAGADGAVPVPTLGQWALVLLAALLALLAWRGLLPLPGRATRR